MCPAMSSSWWDTKSLEFFWSQTAPVPLTFGEASWRVKKVKRYVYWLGFFLTNLSLVPMHGSFPVHQLLSQSMLLGDAGMLFISPAPNGMKHVGPTSTHKPRLLLWPCPDRNAAREDGTTGHGPAISSRWRGWEGLPVVRSLAFLGWAESPKANTETRPPWLMSACKTPLIVSLLAKLQNFPLLN
jgi:hypothetical protein